MPSFLPKPVLPVLKALLHLLLLLPLAHLLRIFHNGTLALDPDPVNYLTHFTGNWALWLLLGTLALTPLRRLHPRLALAIRFRRMVGLYAFLYATLHLATYVFLFSGYDLPAALHATAAGHPAELLHQWRLTWPTILDDLKQRHFLQVGLLAWLLLLALALTSPTRILRAIGGRAWQRLHRLIYVAAIAAVIHFWWLSKPRSRAPWVDTAILAALLLARLAWSTIDNRRKRRRAAPSPVPRPA